MANKKLGLSQSTHGPRVFNFKGLAQPCVVQQSGKAIHAAALCKKRSDAGEEKAGGRGPCFSCEWRDKHGAKQQAYIITLFLQCTGFSQGPYLSYQGVKVYDPISFLLRFCLAFNYCKPEAKHGGLRACLANLPPGRTLNDFLGPCNRHPKRPTCFPRVFWASWDKSVGFNAVSHDICAYSLMSLVRAKAKQAATSPLLAGT